jgi:hypothetical protein
LNYCIFVEEISTQIVILIALTGASILFCKKRYCGRQENGLPIKPEPLAP